MSYNIHITKAAERDLNNTLDYIEFILKNPKAADDLLNDVEIAINALEDYPESREVINDPVLKSCGMRYIIINNYLAFYLIKGDTIYVVRFLYAKRDWLVIMNNEYSLE